MSFPFNPERGLIIVRVEVFGPSGSAILRLALDTGATSTLINAGPLTAMGYDPTLTSERFELTTGSGVEYAPRITLLRISALGESRKSFPALCHTLPPTCGVDGLLGLDFFRGRTLQIDFQKGLITLP